MLHTLTQSSRIFFKFVWHFGTTCHKSANENHVHDYPLGPARNYQKIKKLVAHS